MFADDRLLRLMTLLLLHMGQALAFVSRHKLSASSLRCHHPFPYRRGVRRGGTSSPTARDAAVMTTTQLYGDLAAARIYIQDGMQAFRQGNVKESVGLFDRAEAAEPRIDPFLWQRGLSYYYIDDFGKASAQFRRDVTVNPRDVEEIVWDIASQCRQLSTTNTPVSLPLPTSLALPRGQTDPRPIMAVVYRLFRGEATEHALLSTATTPNDRGTSRQAASDEFYALFYLGLYNETAGRNPTKAEHYLRQAVHTAYAQNLGRSDYMVDVARVHCRLRGWNYAYAD